MKKIFLVAFTFAGFAVVGNAQTKAQLTAKIKTPNALCQEDKVRIESYLNRYDGLVGINVNFRRGETTVKYLTDRTDIEQIKTAISNAGYDADDVLANAESYKRLPKSCKKFEDGGGHPKPKVAPPAETPAG